MAWTLMGRKSCCEPFQQFIAGCFQMAKVLNKCSQYATWYPFFYISSQKLKKKHLTFVNKYICTWGMMRLLSLLCFPLVSCQKGHLAHRNCRWRNTHIYFQSSHPIAVYVLNIPAQWCAWIYANTEHVVGWSAIRARGKTSYDMLKHLLCWHIVH